MRAILLSGLMFLSAATYASDAYASEPDDTEATEKEPLSEFDFSQQQRELFNKADLNFDGRITHDEVRLTQFENQKKKFEKRFKELDTNFSGYLEAAEVESWHVDRIERRVTGFERQKEGLLKTYDLDKNGTISAYELDQVFEIKAEKERANAVKSAERDFAGKDADRSGSISMDEYIQSKAPKPVSERGDRSRSQSLVQDINGDGVITRTENENYVSKFFQHLDKNDDGELSAQEQKHKSLAGFQQFQPNSIFVISGNSPGMTVNLKR